VNIKLEEVYTLKLNSGEELIAKVKGIEGNELIVAEPVSIAPGPQGMGLVPSMFTADPKGEYRLNTNSISIYAVTDASVKNKYVEATTGIKLPEKKLVLG
jgi:hypothetical protein